MQTRLVTGAALLTALSVVVGLPFHRQLQAAAQQPSNYTPVAYAQSRVVLANAATPIRLEGTDADGDALG